MTLAVKKRTARTRRRIVQKVLQHELKQKEAARLLGVSERQVRRLVRAVRQEPQFVAPEPSQSKRRKATATPGPPTTQNAIAIVGHGCRLPNVDAASPAGLFLSGNYRWVPSVTGEQSRASACELVAQTIVRAIERSGVSSHTLCNADTILSLSHASDQIELARDVHHTLGLRGPYTVVDTAHCGSLGPLRDACHALRAGHSRYAIAAIIAPLETGTATIAFVLQRQTDALSDNTAIWALVAGIHDTISPRTCASTRSQQCLTRALDQAKYRPHHIECLEASASQSLTHLGHRQGIIDLCCHLSETPEAVRSVVDEIPALHPISGMAGVLQLSLMLGRRQRPLVAGDWVNSGGDTPTLQRTALHEPLRVGCVLESGSDGQCATVIVAEPSLHASTQLAEKKSSRCRSVFPLSADSKQAFRTVLKEWRAFAKTTDFTNSNVADLCHQMVTRPRRRFRSGVPVASLDDITSFLQMAENDDNYVHDASEGMQFNLAFSIGRLSAEASSRYRRLAKKDRPFQTNLQTCKHHIQMLPNSLDARDRARMRTRMVERRQRLDDFCLTYALAKRFLDIGLCPDRICGSGESALASLCASGVIKLETALTTLLGFNELTTDQLAAPHWPFLNQRTQTVVAPFAVGAQAVLTLSTARHELASMKEVLASRMAQLEQLDRTVTRRRLEHWQARVAPAPCSNPNSYMSLKEWLFSTTEIQNGSLTALLCLRDVDAQYGVNMAPTTLSSHLTTLVELVEMKLLDSAEINTLFDATATTAHSLATTLNDRLASARVTGTLPVFIPSIESLKQLHLAPPLPAITQSDLPSNNKKWLILDIGGTRRGRRSPRVMHIKSGDDLEAAVTDTTLKLWLLGFELDLSQTERLCYRPINLPSHPYPTL